MVSSGSGVACRVSRHNRQATHVITEVATVAPLDAEQFSSDSTSQAVPRTSFARMLSPLQVAKLQQNSFEYNNDAYNKVMEKIFHYF